ncbi:hypothetical protein [Erythrobacter sp. WG]|uniref:hypothetical protein n=1 Tax=Erythrobacter sp. WG TaxID=2985510 RepID=UPI0022701C1B|nr:hypothetical protein [Erythrobacter sp. WG]MCX9147154.1 hypothetical protein [Erythrobacter sp. WG]
MESDSGNAQLNEDEAASLFFRLLGELHHSYTALEHELTCAVYVAVTRLEKRDDAVVAMLGGQRMSPLKDTIKRLLRVTGAETERKQYVDTLFSHLGELQFFRDRLTHFLTVMSEYNPECWVNMNFTGIREREKMEDLHFNLYALHAATCDLRIMRMLVGPIFSYRLEGAAEPLPSIPGWMFEPSMLVRDGPAKPKRPNSRLKNSPTKNEPSPRT